MMNKLLLATLAASSLLLAACLDEAPEGDREVEIVVDDYTKLDGDLTAAEDGDKRRPRALCEQIVETEGACAAACDADALLGYIPAGTCAFYNCTLEDGRTVRVGGCNQ